MIKQWGKNLHFFGPFLNDLKEEEWNRNKKNCVVHLKLYFNYEFLKVQSKKICFELFSPFV